VTTEQPVIELSVGRAARYAEVSASIRAMKSEMLGPDGYDRLLASSSSSECASTLREQGYFGSVSPAGEGFGQPSSWQALLDARVAATIKKMVRLSPPDCGHLLEAFEGQYRLELLKSGLRMIATQEQEKSEAYVSEAAFSNDMFRSIVESRNVELLVQYAKAQGLHADLVAALAENKPSPLLEAMVDRYALTQMWKAADMPDSVDRQSARALVGEQIDLLNLLLVLRSKSLQIADEEIQHVLISVNYRLGETLSEATGAGSVIGALRVLAKTPYAAQVNAFLDSYKEGDALHSLDVSLHRRHAAACRSGFSGFPFSAGLPLAFAYLMAYEVSDVRSILGGKHDGISRDRIEELLVLQKAL